MGARKKEGQYFTRTVIKKLKKLQRKKKRGKRFSHRLSSAGNTLRTKTKGPTLSSKLESSLWSQNKAWIRGEAESERQAGEGECLKESNSPGQQK